MKSLKIKLSVFQGLAGFLGLILVFLINLIGSQQRILNNAINDADSLSDQIGYSISIIAAQSENTTFNYQRLIEKIATLNQISSIKILDENGVILADSNQNLIGESLSSPLFNKTLENQRKEQQINGKTLITVRPLRGASYTPSLNDIVGVLWIEQDLTLIYTRTRNDMLLLLLVSLGGFLIIFFWYFQITQRGILDRLKIISNGLLGMEKGDLTQRILVKKLFGSEDEINSLAQQFNQMTASLYQKLTFEELTSYLAAKFMIVSSNDMDGAIQGALQRMGSLFKIDRAYVFEFSNHGTIMNNTYEWCERNIDPQIENLKDIPSSIFPWWMEYLNKGETILIKRVSEMPPEASAEQGILAEQGIQSVLVMPMASDSGLFGFLGLDSVARERDWTKEEINLLRVLVGLVTNTIIRQRSQQELIDQRDFALQIMNTVRQGLTVTNEQGLFEYVNPAYAEMLKCNSSNLIGKSPREFTHPDDRQNQVEEALKRRLGQASTYVSRLLAFDGTIANVMISATPYIRGGVVRGSIAAIINMNDQLQVEEKLRQSEERNRAFLNAIPDLIFHIDENGKFLDYKDGDDNQFFTPRETIIGASIDSIFPPDVSKIAKAAINNALQTSTPQVFEYKLQTPGGLQTFEARIATSAATEVIAVVHDISARARLEQMKTDFINRASHELRTPLTTALLMVDLLDRDDLEEAESRDYWKILKQELNRERIILEDVLTVGRIESGRYSISGGSVSIMPVLNNAVNIMQAQADLRNIEIQVEVPDELPNVRGAEDAFARILNNVISNAVKFSIAESVVKVRAFQLENDLVIEVQDHGVGIPPEDLPHITSRFFRGSNATEQEIPGSGIGLYIIKSIVEELGGKLLIQSHLNQGTTVTVRLPIVQMESTSD